MHILERIKTWLCLTRLLGKAPGPLLAKFTRLWKLWHLLHGTYKHKLQELHALHGPFVQVAHCEFSWQFKPQDVKQLRDLEKRALPGADIVQPEAVRSLVACTEMDKLNKCEHLIDDCNERFNGILATAAEAEKPVDLGNVVCRYAYDVMFAMTTGERAGYLDQSPEMDRVHRKLASWKFHAVLYGCFLRYHPLIKSVLKTFGCKSIGESTLSPALEVFGGSQASTAASQNDSEHDQEAQDTERHHDLHNAEARAALALAGADPVIKILQEVLKTLSADQQLQTSLVEELTSAGLTTAPSLQELTLCKLHMPRMHALIQHCMRITDLSDTGLNYIAPAGGIKLGKVDVEATHTINVTSDHRLFSELDLHSDHAIDSGLSPEVQRNLPAFNLWHQDHTLENCDLLLVSKLLFAILSKYKLFCANNPGHVIVSSRSGNHQTLCASPDSTNGVVSLKETRDENGIESGRAGSFKTVITPSDMDVLGENFGPRVTDEFLRLFDPHPNAIYGKEVFRIGPVDHSAARAFIHRALNRMYGDRLRHVTDVDRIIHVAAKSTFIKYNRPGKYGSRSEMRKKIKYSDVKPWYKTIAGARCNTASRPVNNAWADWVAQEREKSIDGIPTDDDGAKTQTRSVATAVTKADLTSTNMTFKETFKQTGGGTTSSGARKVLRTENTTHDANGSTVTSSEGVILEAESQTKAPQSPTTRPDGWVPPHLRARIDRERQAAEAAAASAIAQSIPLPISPVEDTPVKCSSAPDAEAMGHGLGMGIAALVPSEHTSSEIAADDEHDGNMSDSIPSTDTLNPLAPEFALELRDRAE